VRILIVKLGSIGDIVHTLPAFAAIRRQYPTATIGWVVEKRSAEILRGNPLIDCLIEIDTRALRKRLPVNQLARELRLQVRKVRKLRFDVALDFQGLLKSAAIAKLSGAKRRWGFAGRALREPASRIFLTDTVQIAEGAHIIEKNLMLADAALGLGKGVEKLDFPISTASKDVAEADAIILKTGPRFAILNPGGGWPTKLWPAENYGILADHLWNDLGLKSVIVCGPKETGLVERAIAASRSQAITQSRLGLKALVELAKKATVYIGSDTGPTHLAMAAGTPLVGLFGPTEWWRNGSIAPDDICVERTDIDCRENCHRRSCAKWICMDIGVERVLEAVRERIERSGGKVVSVNLNGNKI
jgi:heptosyltransferase-1